MSNNTVQKVANRIDADLSAWERMEQKFSKRYGQEVWKARDSMKVRRDIYAHIINKHTYKPLTREEEMELRMLKGQHRAMNKKLYPNPYVRLVRNMLVFAGNTIRAAVNILLIIPKAIIDPTSRPGDAPIKEVTVQEPSKRAANKVKGPVSAQKEDQKNNQTQQQAPGQAVVKRMGKSPHTRQPASEKGLHI